MGLGAGDGEAMSDEHRYKPGDLTVHYHGAECGYDPKDEADGGISWCDVLGGSEAPPEGAAYLPFRPNDTDYTIGAIEELLALRADIDHCIQEIARRNVVPLTTTTYPPEELTTAWTCDATGCTCLDPDRTVSNHFWGPPHKSGCGCPYCVAVRAQIDESLAESRKSRATGDKEGPAE
jgi:hypothetical protein